MPELTGLDVVRTIGAERMPPVIFVTAHDRYALRAFELAAVDYLLGRWWVLALGRYFRTAASKS